jgi:hypothetical protein
MAGSLVPLVMLPRYTTLVGQLFGAFTTVPVEVADYQKAILTLWRGPIRAGATFNLACEESGDREAWTTCSGTSILTQSTLPENDDKVVTATLTKRWFRMRIALTNPSGAQATFWAVGHLERRER